MGATNIGRYSEGLDESEFDIIPPHRHMQFPNQSEGAAGDELDLMAGDNTGEDDLIVSTGGAAPSDTGAGAFPRLAKALKKHHRKHQQKQAGQSNVQLDTPTTFSGMVADKVADEIQRRLLELRGAIEEHEADGHGPKVSSLRTWSNSDYFAGDRGDEYDELFRDRDYDDDYGAPSGPAMYRSRDTDVSKLRAARDADEGVKAMPSVDVDAPDWAKDSVDAWKDGPDIVIVSLKFCTDAGEPMVASASGSPVIDTDKAVAAAKAAGLNPTTVLGALPDAADKVCANKLLTDVVGAALEVCGMDGPSPDVSAIMEVQAQADAGDAQAARELTLLDAAVDTTLGQVVAKPLVDEAKARRKLAKNPPAKKDGSFMSWYSDAVASLG